MLASAMEHNEFSDWERVIVAVDNEKICGYCTTDYLLQQRSGIRNVNLIDFICKNEKF